MRASVSLKMPPPSRRWFNLGQQAVKQIVKAT
jgi:hypothetical protein